MKKHKSFKISIELESKSVSVKKKKEKNVGSVIKGQVVHDFNKQNFITFSDSWKRTHTHPNACLQGKLHVNEQQ